MDPIKFQETKACKGFAAAAMVFFFLLSGSLTLNAAPPPGKGSDRSQEVTADKGPSAEKGSSGEKGAPAEKGPSAASFNAHARSETGRRDVRKNSTDRMLSRQLGGKNFFQKKAGDYGTKDNVMSDLDEPEKFRRALIGKDRHDSFNKSLMNRLLISNFEMAIGKLRTSDRSGWDRHPMDTRGQGNMGKVDMMDPYGFSKDNRMELYGNRGRVIREPVLPPPPPAEEPPPPAVEPPAEEPPPPPPAEEPPPVDTTEKIVIETETVNFLRYAKWYGPETTTNLLMDNLGYTYEQAIYLQTLSLSVITDALTTGYLLWTP